MRVVILTSNYHLAANTLVKSLLENKLLKKHKIEIVGIVSAATFDFTKRSLKVMWRFLKKSGFWFFTKTILISIIQRLNMLFARIFLPDRRRKYFEVFELAKKYKIPYISVSNINSKTSLGFMKKLKPDYLVSCLLLQIVKKPLLNLPKKGAINFHPALIQKHRGIFTSFWALLKNWRRFGATVHFMTEKVDQGKIIIQRRLFIRRSDTVNCINLRSAKLGGKMLAKALVKLKKNKTKALFSNELGKVFSMPTTKDVNNFIKKGKELIKTKNLFDV